MVDLLVVNFNTKDKLSRLINTLWGTLPQGEQRLWTLHIADNGSTDGSVEWIKDNNRFFDSVRLNENIGYAKAINAMAAATNNEVLAALNADVWMTNVDILNILAKYDSDPTISILGPKQRNEAGRITHAGIIDIHTKPIHRGWSQFDINDELYRHLEDVGTVSGSAYFVRRSAWETLTNCPIYQGIDPGSEGAMLQTPLYYEETWVSVHALAHNYRVTYDGTVSIGHSWHASAPVGSQTAKMQYSQQVFRKACQAHQIRTEWD
jgi:glycosyltransferase involved in cell wall biosynthesis